MVIICQREHLQWDVVKRLHTLDVEGVEEILTTNKKACAQRVDTVQPAKCESTAGPRNLTDLRRESF